MIARVVKAVEGETAWRRSPNQAFLRVVRQSIDALDKEMSGRPTRGELVAEGRSKEGPWHYTGKWKGSPARRIALILYGELDDDPEIEARLDHEGRRLPFTYNDDYLPAAHRLANVAGRSVRVRQRPIRVIREDLAQALLDMEAKAINDQSQVQVRAEEAVESTSSESEIEQALIDRQEYLTRLRGHLDAGYRIICIWGEPGTGKTTLAKQFAARLDGIKPTLTIRMAPVLEAPTTESLVFRQDLVDALIAEGMEPTNWSLEYALSKLRNKIAEEPQAKAVVIDNVEREELLWQLIPAQPKIPVIVTMHTRPQGSNIACEELRDFTESQAREFINHHLVEQDEQEAVALASALGYRPLALEHAVLFVKESPDVSVRSLTRSLTINAADTLTTVTPPEQRERNLSRLYEIILASLIEHEPGQVILDTFLATAGQTGVRLLELVYTFAESSLGGSHDRLYFRAGLRELARRGLLRERDVSRLDPFRTDGDSLAPAVELSMHTLTYRILRDLRGLAPLEIEARYLEFLRTADHGAADSLSAHGPIHAWIAQKIMQLVQDGLPDGWLSLLLVDESTWVAIQKPQEDADSREPYAVRYVIQADGYYKLDYHTGQWSELDGQESQELRLAAVVYRERIKPEFATLISGSISTDEQQVPEVRLDREVTPADRLFAPGH